jgi:hypothetical protein
MLYKDMNVAWHFFIKKLVYDKISLSSTFQLRVA